jgi:hypothetical protein
MAGRMGKGHATAGVWPWAVRGADADAGRRAGARDVVTRRCLGLNVLLIHCSKLKNSKILYTHA